MTTLPPAKRKTIVREQRAIVDTVTGLLIKIDPIFARDANRGRVQAMLLFGIINWTHTWYDPGVR